VIEDGRGIVFYSAIETCARCRGRVPFGVGLVLTRRMEGCLWAKEVARQGAH
jgi:hypothetical protein